MSEHDWRSKNEQQWRELLTDNAYHVLREKGTERPFSGQYLSCDKNGVYRCAGCGQALFEADAQFDAHCGWPSFDKALDGAVTYVKDNSHGMIRTEVVCSRCDGHLGHVFDDGPTDSGQRYCVNSVAMRHEDES